MSRIAGWLLIVIGGVYPAVLILFWVIGLLTLLASGEIIGLEHLVGMVWPFGLIVSALVLLSGIRIVYATNVKEASNAGRQ